MRRIFLFKKKEISAGWDWSTVTYTESDAGRKFARYSAVSGNPNIGTVMSMNDGTDRNILVLDAQYRTNNKAYYTDYTVNLNDTGNQLDLCTNLGYFSGSMIELPCPAISDDTLNTNHSTICNQDTKTSYYNTQKLIDYNSTNSEAAAYCRSITVNGTGCDLPNINTLIRIYCEMTKLDNMDPTVTDYSDYALCSWTFAGNYGCWSSSWYGNYSSVYYAMGLGYYSAAANDIQNSIVAVTPILEL